MPTSVFEEMRVTYISGALGVLVAVGCVESPMTEEEKLKTLVVVSCVIGISVFLG